MKWIKKKEDHLSDTISRNGWWYFYAQTRARRKTAARPAIPMKMNSSKGDTLKMEVRENEES